jgi:hypothetical protein
LFLEVQIVVISDAVSVDIFRQLIDIRHACRAAG